MVVYVVVYRWETLTVFLVLVFTVTFFVLFLFLFFGAFFTLVVVVSFGIGGLVPSRGQSVSNLMTEHLPPRKNQLYRQNSDDNEINIFHSVKTGRVKYATGIAIFVAR